MAIGKERAAWQHTSLLAAPLWQAIRDPKKKPLTPADFDPFAPAKSAAPQGIDDLRIAFLGRYGDPSCKSNSA